MHQQNSFDPSPFEFPLPGQQTGERRRHGRQQGAAEIAVRNQRQILVAIFQARGLPLNLARLRS
jgi:hypothetical protein